MSQRYDFSRRVGYRDESASSMDDHHRDRMARSAEEWLARYLGADARLTPLLGRDDWDIEYRGWRIDVKWTRYEPGGPHRKPGYSYLSVPTWKPRRAHLYALVIGESPDRFDRYEWADGWETKRVVEAAQVVDVGHARKTSGRAAPMFWIGFDFLHQLRRLKELLPMVDPKRGPFCTVPGCVQPAEGAVLQAYVKEQRHYLCVEHFAPVREQLLKLLKREPVVSEAY